MSLIGQNYNVHVLADEAVALLQQLIAIPSFSQQEHKAACLLYQYLEDKGFEPLSQHNNVWAFSDNYYGEWPTILLNSHHDTVKPVASWSKDPFEPHIEDGKLNGLGSNDAGGALVSLLHTFLWLNQQPDRQYNLIFAATGEEEISGKNGIEAVLPKLGEIDLGIVGEPTQMKMAIAEKGLLVIDGIAKGVSGHAARQEGVNAIYIALQDIQWLKDFHFPEKSKLLGEVHMAVTQIQGGTQHNVVPDECTFVVDVRTNEKYTNEEVFKIIQRNTNSLVKPRSLRLNSSRISRQHPVVKRGLELGLPYFGSPTLSDQALMRGFPTLKIGPGNSERSHTADEYIYLDEIKEGISIYIDLLTDLKI